MQHLLDVSTVQTNSRCRICDVIHRKLSVWYFSVNGVSVAFSLFKIGGDDIQFVTEFGHLGHVINSSLTDDEDINREVRNMFVRKNVLLRRFGNCSVSTMWTLFKSCCMSMHA